MLSEMHSPLLFSTVDTLVLYVTWVSYSPLQETKSYSLSTGNHNIPSWSYSGLEYYHKRFLMQSGKVIPMLRIVKLTFHWFPELETLRMRDSAIEHSLRKTKLYKSYKCSIKEPHESLVVYRQVTIDDARREHCPGTNLSSTANLGSGK